MDLGTLGKKLKPLIFEVIGSEITIQVNTWNWETLLLNLRVFQMMYDLLDKVNNSSIEI